MKLPPRGEGDPLPILDMALVSLAEDDDVSEFDDRSLETRIQVEAM